MEFRHLRYFVAVAEEQHFGRAAQRLHVSQSPLSRQIAQLAAEIGVPLFVPAGRGVKLTDAGRSLLDGARATLERAELAVREARETARGGLGTVTIGFEGGSAYGGGLPEAVSVFRAQHPRVSVRLVPMSSAEQWQALRAGTITLAYGYGAPDDDPEIHSQVLFSDPMALVVPREHRLAKQRTVRIRDLKGESFVWFPREASPLVHDALVMAFRARGQSLDIQEERDGEAMVTLVASGAGLSFSVASAQPLIRGAVVLKRVVDLGVVLEGRSSWRRADERTPLVKSLREIVARAHRSARLDGAR